jgi:hypothetical protein
MDERRNFPRFAIELDAKFITTDGKTSLCKLTDISREGTCIEIFSKEKMEIGTGIKMEIAAPKKESPIIANVITMWVTEIDDSPEYHYLAGGLLSEIDPKDKSYLLDQAYAIFKESGA